MNIESQSVAPVDAATRSSDTSSSNGWWDTSTSWVASAATDSLVAYARASNVVGQFGVGFAKEVYEHPLQTAAEVATGAAFVTVSAAAGLEVAGAALIAAVPAAAYGGYKAGQIALTEGVGAIPDHMAKVYDQGKQDLQDILDSVATVYGGSADSSQRIDCNNSAVTPCLLQPPAWAGPKVKSL